MNKEEDPKYTKSYAVVNQITGTTAKAKKATTAEKIQLIMYIYSYKKYARVIFSTSMLKYSLTEYCFNLPSKMIYVARGRRNDEPRR